MSCLFHLILSVFEWTGVNTDNWGGWDQIYLPRGGGGVTAWKPFGTPWLVDGVVVARVLGLPAQSSSVWRPQASCRHGQVYVWCPAPELRIKPVVLSLVSSYQGQRLVCSNQWSVFVVGAGGFGGKKSSPHTEVFILTSPPFISPSPSHSGSVSHDV